jgi:hypothetical protein
MAESKKIERKSKASSSVLQNKLHGHSSVGRKSVKTSEKPRERIGMLTNLLILNEKEEKAPEEVEGSKQQITSAIRSASHCLKTVGRLTTSSTSNARKKEGFQSGPRRMHR